MALKFPERFLWGAATAAHQVEGNNRNSDFWIMEHLEGTHFKEPSGDAVDHYRLYRQDLEQLAALGLNSFRFSIEWARIEPEEGMFDEAAIEHYRDVLRVCAREGITPVVTLHHFTSPHWLIREGGWESPDTPTRFARYVEHVMRELGEHIPYVCTLNEANISIGIRKIMKKHSAGGAAQVGINTAMMARMEQYNAQLGQAFGLPPQEIHSFLAPRTEAGLKLVFDAHMAAKAAIRNMSPRTKVGVTLSLYDIQSIPGGEAHAAGALQEEFLQFLPYLKDDDFFGLQNYTRAVYGPDGLLPVPDEAEKTQMGNEYYPQGLEAVIRKVSSHLDLPILITENGIATDDDDRRVAFIDRALRGVHACVADGIPVIGYLHWSLLDNFEWQLGFSKRFGLIGVDRSTQQRNPKPSASYLGHVAKSNELV
ncbi:glycoside hydrolase family 1 protein [Paenibacillus sp.]|uniref:glycoside hydrolase family 1 protein n=1 Tax=Paenibacillus sp. TaxID=58172 RepID=UPI002D715DC9|nr:family 1 glycosylhydrolase [Paenibacillus sp.]HZG87994.1 family 1 glycosylhydrolase [Paenibacillus sp.]